MTKEYIGTKKVTAWTETKDGQAGYTVKYEDGYMSWSPRQVFEKSYFPVGHQDIIKIMEPVVDNFIATYEDSKFDDHTTIVKATLVNGFTILEHSCCVDSKTYNHEIGIELCKKKIKNQVWHLLGFLLQTANNGVQFMTPEINKCDTCKDAWPECKGIKEDLLIFYPAPNSDSVKYCPYYTAK